MLYSAFHNGKWGYINKLGEFTIEPKFDFVSEFIIDRALVSYDSQTSVIDEKGEFVFNVNDKSLSLSLSHDRKIITEEKSLKEKDTKYSVFDNNGQFLFSMQCLDLGGFTCGLARIMILHDKDSSILYGFINEQGEYVIPPTCYESLENFSENLACFGEIKDGKYVYGFINKKGEKVIPASYSSVSQFKRGLAPVKHNENDDTVLYINKSNSIEIKLNVDRGYLFSEEGLARIKKDGKYGFIDTKGNMQIPCNYLEPTDFQEGLASAKNNDGFWGVIDKKGTFIIDPTYLKIGNFRNGLAKAIKQKKSTILGPIKKNVLELSYITPNGDNMWKVNVNMGSWNMEKSMHNWVKC